MLKKYLLVYERGKTILNVKLISQPNTQHFGSIARDTLLVIKGNLVFKSFQPNGKTVGKSLHIHFSGLAPKPGQGKDSHFMVRARDIKGKYIPIKKNPEYVFGSRKVPHINFVDGYTGRPSRVAKVSTCWKTKEPQPTTMEKPEKQ